MVEDLTDGGDVPVELYVIGFGSGAGGASNILQGVARAAEPTSGPGNYYQVDTVEGLIERLYIVAAGLQNCDFTLDAPVDDVSVWIGDTQISVCPEGDCVSGYTYDADSGTVSLAPATCREASLEDCSLHFETP